MAGKQQDQPQPYDVGQNEGHDAGIDLLKYLTSRASELMTKTFMPIGGVDEAEFDRHHDDDAEPDRVEAQRHRHGEEDRDHQDDHRHGVQDAAQKQQEQKDDQERGVGAEVERQQVVLQSSAAPG